MTDTGPLTQLGANASLPDSPDAAVLEKVANPQPDSRYVVRFTCPEFTSICPVTGQPDFAHLVIDYLPGGYIVESKSLKLYLGSFRNHGATPVTALSPTRSCPTSTSRRHARRPGSSATYVPGVICDPGGLYDPDRNTPKIEIRRISDLQSLGSHDL